MVQDFSHQQYGKGVAKFYDSSIDPLIEQFRMGGRSLWPCNAWHSDTFSSFSAQYFITSIPCTIDLAPLSRKHMAKQNRSQQNGPTTDMKHDQFCEALQLFSRSGFANDLESWVNFDIFLQIRPKTTDYLSSEVTIVPS